MITEHTKKAMIAAVEKAAVVLQAAHSSDTHAQMIRASGDVADAIQHAAIEAAEKHGFTPTPDMIEAVALVACVSLARAFGKIELEFRRRSAAPDRPVS